MIWSNPTETDSDVLKVTELAWDKYQWQKFRDLCDCIFKVSKQDEISLPADYYRLHEDNFVPLLKQLIHPVQVAALQLYRILTIVYPFNTIQFWTQKVYCMGPNVQVFPLPLLPEDRDRYSL